MPNYAAVADGNYSTAATWGRITNTPTIHASTNVTVTVGAKYTATFTAPNTTDSCTGVLVYVANNASSGNITATLQESTVDTVAAVTIANSALVTGGWVYLKFATPYVFTTTGAGAYRFKIVVSAGAPTLAADSGGSLFAFQSVDTRTGTPTTGDDVYVVQENGTGTRTVTVTGTSNLLGSGTDTSASPLARSIGHGCQIHQGGVLTWDTTASATLQTRGSVVIGSGGTLSIGTTGTPIPIAYTGKLLFDENGVDNRYHLQALTGATMNIVGATRSYWTTTYVSGAGTAASPFITSTPVDWSVGDEILIAPSQSYLHTETRFIITKNSTTSYVLSTTAGGAEAALTYTHTAGDPVDLVSRNVQVSSTSTTVGHMVRNDSVSGTTIKWARFDYLRAAAAGLLITNVVGQTAVLDYNVIFNPLHTGIASTTSKTAQTWTGNIIYGPNTSGNAQPAVQLSGTSNNKTLVDWHIYNRYRAGLFLSSVFATTLTRPVFRGLNHNNSVSNAGLTTSGAGATTINNGDFQANRNGAVYLNGATDFVFNSCNFGTIGSNTTAFVCASDSYATVIAKTCNFGSDTLTSNYLNLISGSEIAFHKYNATENNHIVYTANGTLRSTGTGLADTTIKSANSLGLRLAPETTDGRKFSFDVLAIPDKAVSVFGYCWQNATFVSDGATTVDVNLYLPGSTTPDATQTLTKTSDNTSSNAVFALSASYTGDVYAYATVEVVAKNPSATASAYCYVDDIYNGTNNIVSIDTWKDGSPSTIMFEQLGDASAVWAVLTSTQTTTGTMGYFVTKLLTVAKFLGLK